MYIHVHVHVRIYYKSILNPYLMCCVYITLLKFLKKKAPLCNEWNTSSMYIYIFKCFIKNQFEERHDVHRNPHCVTGHTWYIHVRAPLSPKSIMVQQPRLTLLAQREKAHTHLTIRQPLILSGHPRCRHFHLSRQQIWTLNLTCCVWWASW